MGENELVLDGSLFLGKGTKRICYRHPQDASKCIKIDLNEKRKVTLRELKYYKRYARKGVRFDLIAPYYGEVMTNEGKGYVFGLARDYDGEISKQVRYYLKTCRDIKVLDDVFRGMQELKKFMIFHGVMTTLVEHHNMVYQRITHDNGKVIFIDGIGNNQLFPLANYLRLHGRRVVRRKWFKFERQLMNWYRDTPPVYSRLKVLNETHV